MALMVWRVTPASSASCSCESPASARADSQTVSKRLYRHRTISSEGNVRYTFHYDKYTSHSAK